MNYSVEDILKDVRVAMDMDREPSALIAAQDIDTLTTNDIIRSHIEDAVHMAHNDAPFHLLELGHQFGEDGVFWADHGSGWVLLPDDFMRLVVFQMSDWLTPVFGLITPSDPEYIRQKSPHRFVRGTFENPVCALVTRPEGQSLEFYSCRSEEAYISKAVYLPWPHIDREGYIDICPKCYRAVVCLLASMCLSLFGNDKSSESLLNQYQELLK